MENQLQIYTLGASTVQSGESNIDALLPRKALALLIYIALAKGVHLRPFLAEMLWGAVNEAKAKTYLRNVLPALTAACGDRISVTRDTICLTSDVYYLDVQVLEDTLTGELKQVPLVTLMRVLQLYKGPFLAGFYIRNAPIFEQWVVVHREYYHRLVLKGWKAVAQRHLDQGEFEAGLKAIDSLLALDPYHEEAHQLRMRLLAYQGKQTEALQQYKQCVDLIYKEIGVVVTPQTTALYLQIKDDKLPPLQIKQKTNELICLERERELGVLHRDLDQTLTGNGQTILIEGQSGSGKSCLSQAFMQHVKVSVPYLRVESADSTPSHPHFQHIFRQLTLPWIQDAPVAELAKRVLTLARTTPLLLILDDMQSADHLTTALFIHLADAIGDYPILLVGLSRPHQHAPLLTPHCSRVINLDRVWWERGELFIDAFLSQKSATVSIPLRRQLYRLTYGHPALTALIWDICRQEEFILCNEAGIWELAYPVPLDKFLVKRVIHILTAILQPLPQTLYNLLRIATIEGIEFTSTIIARVAGELSPTLDKQWQQLDAIYHLIAADQPLSIYNQQHARYRFRSPLLHRYLHKTVSETEYTTLQHALGEAFVTLYTATKI